MMRRLITDGIRTDPEWNGNYTTQPRSAKLISVFYNIATNGGTLGYQITAATHEAAYKQVNDRLAAPFPLDPTTFSTCGTLRATTMQRPV